VGKKERVHVIDVNQQRRDQSRKIDPADFPSLALRFLIPLSLSFFPGRLQGGRTIFEMLK
jgi:hypothetical protein